MTDLRDYGIKLFFHCSLCMAEKPPNKTPRQWASLEAGWSTVGLQVWCKRHNVNVVHVDFEGRQLPGELARHPLPGERKQMS